MKQDGEHVGPLTYESANALLKRLCAKAGLRRTFSMYNFRHRRTTKYAKILTEQQMNHYFGWVYGSRMTRRYIHLSGRETSEKMSRCEQLNPPTNSFCYTCDLTLNLKTALKVEETRKIGDQIMDELIRNPEILKLLTRKLAEKGLTEKLLQAVKKLSG